MADEKIPKTEPEWLLLLGPHRYRMLRYGNTERPFTGEYWNHHGTGVYRCAGCGARLFSSRAKFDSGTGWPSFTASLDEKRIERRADRKHGLDRVEVVCARCNGRLGHVFDDGPEPTGERFCINSACLEFESE
ncbi:peptide-methionine (R)-S-oxide reductase MsrB [Sorangium sp. So ce1389]|uniref:peptide-methionine (R)-S-oxide reductase MsrB n=1 Tax=Sorangium sp. So ce1389 TaxID=3133336 RepID=UPI003F621839